MKRVVVRDTYPASWCRSRMDFYCVVRTTGVQGGCVARDLENNIERKPLSRKFAPSVNPALRHVRFIGHQQAKMTLWKCKLGLDRESADDWHFRLGCSQQIEMPARADAI